MKKISFLFATFVCAFFVVNNVSAAGGSSIPLLESYNNLKDTASIQRGVTLFANRCASCHSLKYLRYSSIADRLGWDEKTIDEKLIRGRAKFHDTFVGGLSKKDALATYGTEVPDLSLAAKYRSPNYLYTYLKAYYTNEKGKTDNYLFPGTAMPNMLAGELGGRAPIYKEVNGKKVIVGTKPSPAPKTQAEKLLLEEKEAKFNQIARDIVNFLEFASEPNKLERYDLGVKVILFLLFLLIILAFLKKDYWQDIKK
jgi:ubiquinol-cytochrome c reductase cytochrome c1 subunit